jgi:EsV-1-7 cysteine-rich motif
MGGRCQNENCSTQAVFNLPGETKGKWCKQHKTNDMIDVFNPKCRYENCKKQPSFNYIDEKKGMYCQFHKLDGMVDIKPRKYCEYKGCKTRACFNHTTESVPKFCSLHKDPDMVDITKSKLCSEDGCNKQPTFGFAGETATHCKTHRHEGMIDVNHRDACLECSKRPTFNFIGKTDALYCDDHKKQGMINVLENRLCKDCSRRAYYGTVSGVPLYCVEHKKNDMTWVEKRLKCTQCDKSPTFGYEKGKPIACREHKKDDMKDVHHIPCRTHLCETRPVRAGYCSRCYIYTFPDSKVTRNFKTKELAVREFLVSKFPDVTILHDKRIDCFLYRPDFSIDMGSHVIVIEVDENQHETYDTSCENKRLMSIFQSFGARPLVMVRFNPDKYDNVKGCWTKECKIRDAVKWNSRLERLGEQITHTMNIVPEKEITISHLFYDKV